MISKSRYLGVSVFAAAALALAGCADTGEGADDTDATQGTAAETTAAETDEVLTLESGVIRATVEDNPMTSVFGDLQNNSAEEITIVGLSADVEAGSYEIHEVVDGVMQEKEDGISIPAGATHVMEPGGDHFMLMDLSAPVEAGEAVTLTVELADGATATLADVPVRTMGAGDEDYGDLEHHTGDEAHDGTGHED